MSTLSPSATERKEPTKLIELRFKLGYQNQRKTYLFVTDTGDFTVKELAALFKVSVYKIFSTYKKYGFDIERFKTNAKNKPPVGAAKKRGAWGDLRGTARTKNLDKIPSPGIFEKTMRIREDNNQPEGDEPCPKVKKSSKKSTAR